MKICIKCKEEKELTEFYKKKDGKDGYRNDCKICTLKDKKEYRFNHKEYNKEYRLNNKEYFTEYNKRYQREYYLKNKLRIDKRIKEYHLNNIQERKKYQIEYCLKNKEKIIERGKVYFKKNKEIIYKKAKERKLNNPLIKLASNIRCLVRNSIKLNGYSKKSKTYEYLGCSFEEFKAHLEKQFTKGMTWENQGQWHLDHIYPVSLAKDEEELIRLNHYTNFQPLWAKDNLKKGNKIIEKQLILI
jgi:hypothetical protein